MEPVTRADRPKQAASALVVAIVPVLNEQDAIADVVSGLLDNGAGHVIVVDGNSTDTTVERARRAGAEVIVETRRGYGRAMMTGIEALPVSCQVVLFFDGDGTDRTDLVPRILAPVLTRQADFAMGSRLSGDREPGSLGAAQVAAGHLAGALIRVFYGTRFTDMSPFRALRRNTLQALGMSETSFGWNLEMQMRVAAAGMRVVEIPVGQRNRKGGVSKVSGDLRVAARAACIIMRTFARLAWNLPKQPSASEVLAAPKRKP